MRRPSALLVLSLSLVLVVAGATSVHPSRAAAQAATPLGTAIPVVNADGAATGTVAVTDVADPLTDFDPTQPAEAGNHYVALTVVFDANAGKKLDVDPSAIVLQDVAGNLWRPAYLPLPDSAQIPQLTGQSLGPGSRISGLLGYVVPDGTAPSRVWYRPDSDHLFPLADLTAPATPVVGQPVSISDSNGATGDVTVAAVEDPFRGYDPASPPEAGSRFVLLTLVYDDSGAGRFDVEPYGLVVRDAHGRLWNSAAISRPSDQIVVPDLTSRQLAPGDRISGAIGFAVPEGVALDALYWQPSGDRLIELASFAPGAATPGAPATVATPAAGAGIVASPVADACADMAPWLAAVRDRIRKAGAMSMEDATLSDPASLAAHQQAYAALAKAQEAEHVPAAAKAVNHALIATLLAYSQSVQSLAAATASGADPDVDITDAVNTFNAAGDRLSAIDRQLPVAAAACGLS